MDGEVPAVEDGKNGPAFVCFVNRLSAIDPIEDYVTLFPTLTNLAVVACNQSKEPVTNGEDCCDGKSCDQGIKGGIGLQKRFRREGGILQVNWGLIMNKIKYSCLHFLYGD